MSSILGMAFPLLTRGGGIGKDNGNYQIIGGYIGATIRVLDQKTTACTTHES